MTATKEEITKVRVPAVMVVGAGRRVGTSTVVQGLIVALKRAGIAVALGKIGPALVDATHQRRISGRLAHTLDFWMLSSKQIQASLARLSVGAELVIIEGQLGVYDTHPLDFCYSREADFAADFRIPTVLVVDARGYRESFAALVKGFSTFHPGLKLCGVIANFVESEEHGCVLREAAESVAGMKYLGGIPTAETLQTTVFSVSELEENKSLLTRNHILAAGDVVGNNVQLDLFRVAAQTSAEFEVLSTTLEGLPRQCRIAVADDAAFHLTIQDNLDLIRRAGVEIVAFSPLADIRLPAQTAGLYIPSGYVGLYAADLAANQTIRQAIREFAEKGGVLYAEGDSVAYLFEEVMTRKSEKFAMVGLIPGLATEAGGLAPSETPAYCEMVSRDETVITRIGDIFRGLKSTRWIYRVTGKTVQCFQLFDREMMLQRKGREGPGVMEGFSPLPHVIATTVQPHWASSPDMAKIFCDAARACAPQGKAK